MLYVEYNMILTKYYESQKTYNDLIDEKEVMFARTQPQAVKYDSDKVNGGESSNVFEQYMIAKERSRIDERIMEQKNILEGRKILKEMKEKELRQSKDWSDRIYCYYYLDRMSLTKIENRIPYSRVQIWRILKKIKSNLDGC